LNKSRYQQESQRFYGGFGNFTDFVTILIKHRLPERNTLWRQEFADKTADVLIKRLNQRILGEPYMKGRKSLSTLISYEVGRELGRPHFHLLIERPNGFTRKSLITVLDRVVGSMEWLINNVDVRDFTDSGCIRYICKGDYDAFILSGCNIKK